MGDLIKQKMFAGEVLLFSNGCYSDYNTQFIGVATKDFDIKEQEQKFLQDSNNNQEVSSDGFIGYLIKHGFLIEANATEINCEDYNFSIEWTRKF